MVSQDKEFCDYYVEINAALIAQKISKKKIFYISGKIFLTKKEHWFIYYYFFFFRF